MAQGGELLASSGLLFAAQGKTQAAGEMQWLGGLSLLGSLLLIIAVWRSASSLVALLPAMFGLWVGVTACIAVFGQIHVLTLVLGASLIGVTIDFPMHYLSKAWTLQPWRSWASLARNAAGFKFGCVNQCRRVSGFGLYPLPCFEPGGGFFGGWVSGGLSLYCLLFALVARQSSATALAATFAVDAGAFKWTRSAAPTRIQWPITVGAVGVLHGRGYATQSP